MAGADPKTILNVERLTVRFGANTIVRDLNLAVQRGATLAVLGPNGAGKTVLFRALIGAVPYEGRVTWAPDTRIGYVPQKLDLERDVPITGRDFLGARAALAKESRTDVPGVLQLVGISDDVASKPIGILSGGQFQRLLIAFSLLGDPNVLLLDEPTAGVDEPGQLQLNELVRRLQHERGMTALFISHEITMVTQYADNVLCLSRDTICMGPPRIVLTPRVLQELYGTPMGHHVHEH